MDDTWIKLYRRIIDNEIFRKDRTAWHIFEVLLVIANRKTGSWAGGLYQLCELCNESKPTLYKAILRLEKAGMIRRMVNGRYTTYYICNWQSYQGREETASKQSVNSGETAGKTLTRIRNKNKENIYVELADQLQRIHVIACEAFGKNTQRYKLSEARKKVLKTRLKEFAEEDLIKAITAVSKSEFHRGVNDRGWEADPYWVLSSFEKTEKWASKFESSKPIDLTKVEIEV